MPIKLFGCVPKPTKFILLIILLSRYASRSSTQKLSEWNRSYLEFMKFRKTVANSFAWLFFLSSKFSSLIPMYMLFSSLEIKSVMFWKPCLFWNGFKTLPNSHITVGLSKQMTLNVLSIMCFLKQPNVGLIRIKAVYFCTSHTIG